MRGSTTLPALGRFANIGGLYSAHDDSFHPGVNLFDKISEDNYDVFDEKTTDINFHMTNTISEKLKLMDIGGELSLSIAAGLLKVSGSGSYISSYKQNEAHSQMTLLYSILTKYQELTSISKIKVNPKALNEIGATHVVVGIQWGARCNITCRYDNKENASKDDINAKLEGLLKKVEIQLEVDIKGHADIKNKDTDHDVNISFEAKSDVSDMDRIPTNFAEALAIAKKVPEAIKNVNDGKGIPLEYTLLPLKTVSKLCGTDLAKEIVVNSVESDTIKRFTSLCERTANAKLKLSSLISSLSQNENWFSDDKIQEVNNLKDRVDEFEGIFKSNFQKALIKFRSGADDSKSSCLDKLIAEFLNINSGLPAYEKQMQPLTRLVLQTNEVKNLVMQENVKFYGKNNVLTSLLSDDGKKIVLYLPEDTTESTETLLDNIGYFNMIIKDAEKETERGTKFAVVHTLFHKVNHKAPMIKRFQGRRITDNDLVGTDSKLLKICCVKIENAGIKGNEKPPPERATLVVRCPKSYKNDCPVGKVVWYHTTCLSPIKVGTGTEDKQFYCKCGSFDPKDTSFRCNSPHHGMEYCNIDVTSRFLKEVNDLEMRDITNILILGETGVGKSTWINAIAKYLSYDTFEKARLSNDKHALIPSKFSYTDEHGEVITIKVGEASENENEEIGASATQEPTSYILDIDEDTRIRLIDTPGIGDVRGISQDEKNFEVILEHLSQYPKIHGICILLKPNNARLGTMLKFCIGELLTHLHKSAASNIMFCFTNCRGTLYRPGETLPVLKKLLGDFKETTVTCHQDNTFCFDNESFRFLACLQNGIEFDESDVGAFIGSWDKAVIETTKLFKYVETLKPHDAGATISLNNCRTWIIELSRPIAEIQENITRKINIIGEEEIKLKLKAENGESLAGQLKIELPQKKMEFIDYPKTVCTNPSCTRHVKMENGDDKTEAIKSCHNHCNVRGVICDTIGDPRLNDCWINAWWRGKCRVCEHDVAEHMHISYNLIEEMVEVEDSAIRERLDKNASEEDKVKKYLKMLDQMKKDEEIELKKIMEISAKFACYLAVNSITPYNDAVEQHISYLIKDKQSQGKSKEVEKLNKTLKSYQEMKNIIDQAIGNLGKSKMKPITTPQEAENLRKELFGLPLNGKTFKDIYEGLETVKSKYVFREETYTPKDTSRRFLAGLKNKAENAMTSVMTYMTKST